MKISTYKADHGKNGGVGFLIRTDGITIFHSGDHFNDGAKLKESFTFKIDYLAKLTNKVDFAFICDPYELQRKGVYYSINKLRPKVMFPVHAGG